MPGLLLFVVRCRSRVRCARSAGMCALRLCLRRAVSYDPPPITIGCTVSHYWHLRTVRDGKVRIRGRWYRPDECYMVYDGRLDGRRFLFALYKGKEELAGLWGTEKAYRDPTDDSQGPECVGGTYPWYFWHAEPAPSDAGGEVEK